MLCCLLVRASNLPGVKKDQRSDPVASLTFRGENLGARDDVHAHSRCSCPGLSP